MPVAANILVIDADAASREGCAAALGEDGYRVRLAESASLGLRRSQEEAFDVVILDLGVSLGPAEPGVPRNALLPGLEVLGRLREDSPDSQVILTGAAGSVEAAVEGMRRGASDYLAKPVAPDAVRLMVRRALDRKQAALEESYLRLPLRERPGPEVLVGDSPAMREVARLLRKLAPTDATVLLIGETGAGKELAARALHQHSHRRDKPFVTVDCAALVETLFESELFGHLRGAYTGAFETTVGKLELASGGTIFLDEVGNIPLELQAKLLRVIQERELCRVGSTRRIQIDVRIVAATQSDLTREMRDGAFRRDLFYRLSVVPIRLPPLRERGPDIRLLAQHFLRKWGPRRKPSVTGFSEAALFELEAYDWPGNVRELENTVERALVLTEGRVIEVGDLSFHGGHAGSHGAGVGGAPAASPAEGVAGTAATASAVQPASPGRLEVMERREIALALDRFSWQMAQTADYLGINRKTLREKIRRYGIRQQG